MAKKQNSDGSKSSSTSKGQVRESHQIGGKEVRSWQPIVDRTTKPPKGK